MKDNGSSTMKRITRGGEQTAVADDVSLSPVRESDPEIQLMLRVQRDEPGAFAELLKRFWSPVFSRLYRQLGDRQEAEDRTQDVFLRVYRSRRRYQPRARFTTWLFHIAQNVVRNALRTRARRPCVPLGRLAGQDEDSHTPDRFLAERWEAPSRPLERAELAGVVRDAIAGLRGRQRRALELHQFQDWTYEEIAAEMAMSLPAAKGLLYRARNQLRAWLTPLVEA
jgi:RNA polymerase sigma-70 factor (ECF subfamily)